MAMASHPSSNRHIGDADRDSHPPHPLHLPSHSHPPPPRDLEPSPLFLGFNQDSTRLACGTDLGFRTYDLYPSIAEHDNFESLMNGGVGIVELMYDRNFAAIVGGGSRPKYPPYKVMMWDFNQGRCTGELCFRSPVRAVKLRLDKLVVILELKIFVYEFETLGLLFSAETLPNPKGLCALSSAPSSSFVFACPGLQKGEVRIEQLRNKVEKKFARDTAMVAAHDSHLGSIALSFDGRLLATASNKGTLIRIFSTFDGTHLQELRRGADRAEIYSIAFSWNSYWLAVSSDKGTIHVFGLHYENTRTNGKNLASAVINANPGSTLSFMKGVLPKYFSSEWSLAQFRLPEEIKSIVAFGSEKHTIHIAGSDGSIYKCVFDPINGGEMMQKEYIRFLKLRNENYG